LSRSESIPRYSAGFEIDTGEIEVVQDGAESEFGRYRLCYQLAAGGMATVYLARAVGPGGVQRPVALKRIHPHLAKRRAFVEMFLDEARIASRINHPNVCTVLDFGEHEGSYYLAMEHLLGESLNSVIHFIARREDLLGSTRWRALAARIIADACEGLHAAHRLKDPEGRPLEVVHRDMSLHNIFVTYAGAVKVLDFGIAKLLDAALSPLVATRSGALIGTPLYMSPEQAAGTGRQVGPASDIRGNSGTREIQLPGLTLLPGLIEGHAHLLLHPYDETPWTDQVLLDRADQLRAVLDHIQVFYDRYEQILIRFRAD